MKNGLKTFIKLDPLVFFFYIYNYIIYILYLRHIINI